MLTCSFNTLSYGYQRSLSLFVFFWVKNIVLPHPLLGVMIIHLCCILFAYVFWVIMSYSITFSLISKFSFMLDIVEFIEFLLQVLEVARCTLEFILFLVRGWRVGF